MKVDYEAIVSKYEEALPQLKGGEVKAYWVILVLTLGLGRRNCIILNESFMNYGSSLTKSRDIINATNSLHDKGLIAKIRDEESEGNGFRYNINLNPR